MAVRVDEAFLVKTGLSGMPADEKEAFIELAQAELETRVGQALGKLLTVEELNEFEGISDPKMAASWLKDHAPTYREMTLSVFEDFKREIMAEKEQIL